MTQYSPTTTPEPWGVRMRRLEAETGGECSASTLSPPIYDPRIDALAREPWFREASEALHGAVRALRERGFRGTLNVPGGSIRVE